MLYESENNRDKGVERLREQFFSILPCISSGPYALLELIFFNKFSIFEGQNSMSDASSFDQSIGMP